MASVRNGLMLGAAAAVLCVSVCTRVAAYGGVEFPEATGIGQAWRYMEGRAVTDLPAFTLESFAAGELQDGIEGFAADSLPFHDQAMLLNAGLQELGISQAAELFGYNVYPTYFGSTRLYSSPEDVVTYMPFRHTEYHDQKLTEYASGLARVARAYPEKRFVVYVVGGYQEPSVNPAYDLVGNAFEPAEAVRIFEAAFAEYPNVSVLTNSYSTFSDYYKDFFRSDHHWNILGALRAYNTIAGELGLEQVDIRSLDLHEVQTDYAFTGATSRWGRHIVTEQAFDTDLDYSSVTYMANGRELDGNDHCAFSDYVTAGVKFAFYDAYFNSIPDGIISATGKGKALLISNSFGGALQRQLATQFETLYKSSALWPGYTGNGFADLLEESDADTVIFVANPTDYMNMAASVPDFFAGAFGAD